MNFSNYLLKLAEALNEKEGIELAYLLSPRADHGKTILKEFRNPTVSNYVQFNWSNSSISSYVATVVIAL